jgi:hypothetical protein
MCVRLLFQKSSSQVSGLAFVLELLSL